MQQKTYTIIGLGIFGRELARTLAKLGHYVMVIDNDQEKINEIANELDEAYCADVTNESVMRDLGVNNSDYVIITMGQNFEAALVATINALEIGATRVLVKASNHLHASILERVGATRVIIPEMDMARKLAHSLTSPNFVDIVELAEGYSMVEIGVPKKWIGKSIEQLNIRRDYHVNVVAIHKGTDVNINPKPSYVFTVEDRAYVLGHTEKIEALGDL